jgi:hypothetical protein
MTAAGVGGTVREVPRESVWRPRRPVDIRATLGVLVRGPGDPAHRIDPDGTFWRAALTPDGGRLEECTALPPAGALARLRVVPGIGVWTAAEVAQRALGDADAVSVGDYHIPSLVGWALAGAPVDDDGMLALLAPYRPHRHRVVRLIELSGVGLPRRGSRMPARDYRSI